MILGTQNLTKSFGGTVALDHVSVEFLPGSVTALVGANGAGKSTLFNVVAGFIAADAGEVYLKNGPSLRVDGLPVHEIARRGIGVLFQEVRVFKKLTVLDNVAAGAQDQPGESSLNALLRRPRSLAREREVQQKAVQLLEFVGLSEQARYFADQLSHGQQKLVALARLLAANAKILLLDEPTAGVHPDRIDQLLKLIRKLAEDHARTIVMIEHNRSAVRRISDRVFRMERGAIVAAGSPQEVLRES